MLRYIKLKARSCRQLGEERRGEEFGETRQRGNEERRLKEGGRWVIKKKQMESED